MKTDNQNLGGFTPCFDRLRVNPRYGVNGSLVYGAIWRHCQMYRGSCSASLDRLTEFAGVKSKHTAIKYIRFLEEDEYIIDTTPNFRYKTHTYEITDKLNLDNTSIDELGVQPLHPSEQKEQENKPQMLSNEQKTGLGVQEGVQSGVQPLHLNIDNIVNTPQENKIQNQSKNQIDGGDIKDFSEDMNIPKIVSDIEEISGHKILPPKDHWNWLMIAFCAGFPDKIKAKKHYEKTVKSGSTYGKWISDYCKELDPNLDILIQNKLESLSV